MRSAIVPTIAAACTAVLVATAAPAHADGNQYLADLAAHGVPMVSQGNALDQGIKVCDALRSGVTPQQTFGNFGFFTGYAPVIVDLAQHDLCPDTIH
jgi:Protein of unknown function (DUF732)